MSKYALSFSTQGNDLNTYYLAAAVLGMIAAKNGSSTFNLHSNYGFTNASYAKQFQTLIDTIFDAQYWKTTPKCYPLAKVYSPANISNNATKVDTSVGYNTSSSSTSAVGITGINAWLQGSSSYPQWSAAINQALPYINYKISCMSETDYTEFVNSVIKAGGLTDFEQTNTPIQA